MSGAVIVYTPLQLIIDAFIILAWAIVGMFWTFLVLALTGLFSLTYSLWKEYWKS